MHVSLIQVPYILGDERLGPSKGSQCLVRAGAEKLLAAKSVAVSMERVDRGEPFRDSGNASLAVGQATRTRCPASHRGGVVSLKNRSSPKVPSRHDSCGQTRASFLGEQSTAEVLEPQPYTPPRFLSCMRPQGDGTSPTEMQSYRRIRPISRDARSSWFLYTVAGLVTKAACTSETPKAWHRHGGQERELGDLPCGTSAPQNWKGYGYCVRKVPVFAGWRRILQRPSG